MSGTVVPGGSRAAGSEGRAVLHRLMAPTKRKRAPLYARCPSGADVAWTAGGLDAPADGASLGTWFNAFPASAWRAIAGTKRVDLRVRGRGEMRVLGSASGAQRLVAHREVAGAWDLDVNLSGLDWCWLELVGAGRIDDVEWSIPARGPALSLPRVLAVVPTFGRHADVVAQAGRFLADPQVGHVVVIDQGRSVRGDAEFQRLMAAHRDRLLVREQDNLGGSGGYARGMLESLNFPDEAVFLSDDDAEIEPESLRRMLMAGALATARRGRPTTVGTGMLSAEEPTVLHSLAERVALPTFMWGPADGLTEPLDVGVGDPGSWRALEPLATTTYSGWWGALLPPGAVARVGLPAPYFLKWDDAEFGLRSQRVGYQVVALPGASVWHPTWGAKGTAASWSALPMHRNRLATAAAYRAGPGVVIDSLVHQIKHVLSLQYGTAELWDAGLAELTEGSASWLGSDLRTVRARGQAVVDAGKAATGGLSEPERAARSAAKARSAVDLGAAILGLIRPRRAAGTVRRVPARDFTWRDGVGADAVVLTGPDGEVVGVLRRSGPRARRILAATVLRHLRTLARWRALSADYARALPHVRTAAYWRATIGEQDLGKNT